MRTPKINVPAVAPGQDTSMYLKSLTDEDAANAYLEFYIATNQIPPADPELVELIRIRNGLAQSCQYCLSVRLTAAPNLGRDVEDKVLRYEDSDLTDRQKAALRLSEAFLTMPSELTAEAREKALEHFTPEEIVGLVYRMASFLVNKPRAALGIDRELDPDHLTVLDPSLAKDMLQEAG